jgi:PAS domain S-box-containing protein
MSSQRMDELGGADSGRLGALASGTSVVVWHTAADGAVETANPSWEAFTGQSFAAYRQWGWAEAIHPDDRAAALRRWNECVEQREAFVHGYRLRRRDGSWRHMQAQGTPVLHDGAIREWVGVCVDVTASEEARQALAQSERRLRFLDQLGQATRSLTDATAVMAVTAQLLGEHLGASRCAYADVEADSDRFTIRNDWSAPGLASSAGVYSLELFGPQATSNLRRGRHLVVHDVDRELGDEGGGRMFNAIGIQAIICAGLVKHDQLVAMMAVHQAQPRHWSAEEIALVGEVVDRCWAHIERTRADAILREQDRRKDEFLATLAHELRNPLAPVKYALEVLQRSGDPQRQAQARAAIDRQVSQMARLIDDLLDLSRVSRGLIRLQLRPERVAELVERAIEAARPAIESAGHTLEVDAQPAAWVNADAARMVQVVSNLLGNAAKYTPPGGRIAVSVRTPGDRVAIDVADNGLGIPPQDQPSVFEMFTQLPHTRGRANGGLGIGLSLVRTLVEMHGGEVTVRSAGIGQGATFTVTLPQLAASADGAAGAGAATAQAAASSETAAVRVAVIEDNEDGRNSLVQMLQLMGHEVASAHDGPSGLQLVERLRPEVVLLDLGLPHMDGIEVCRRIRANPALAGIRVLALTGWGTEADRARTREAGFDLHLTKPVEPAVLQQSLAAARAG